MLLKTSTKRFLAHCGTATTLSEHTLRAYEGDLNDAVQFIGARRKLCDVSKDDLRRYIHHLRQARELKESTIKRRMATLKLLFKWAIHEEFLSSSPFASLNEKIRLPKRLPRALDRDDQARLRRAAAMRVVSDFDTLRQTVAINLLLTTGIRVGELVAIERSDLSMADACIRIHGKGNRQRLAYVHPKPLQRHLSQYLDRRSALGATNDRLFVASDGRPLSTATVRHELRRASQAAGIVRRVTPHMLRHTCATNWLEAGLDIRFVQKLLGHHSISTTEIYTHVSDQGLRDALQRVSKTSRR
nr:tyrosine-type recombinase/integrase [uncultured Roseateles sp.]